MDIDCSYSWRRETDRGFKRESGLKFVRAGETHTGSVTYMITMEV